MTVDRAHPHLLASGRSAALLDGSGDLTLLQESRGAVSDWGGVYARHLRLTGPWSLSFRDEGHQQRLGEGATEFGWEPHQATGRHRLSEFPDLSVAQRVVAVADPPGVLRTIHLSTTGPGRAIGVESAFAPYLIPVMVEGIRPGRFTAQTRTDGLFVRQHGFGLYEATRPAPARRYLNRASWIGGHFQGPISEVGTEHQLWVDPGMPVEIRYWIGGGRTADLGRQEENLRPLLDDPGSAVSASERFWSSWAHGTPRMRWADAPWLETAYDQARRSLRALYSLPDGGLAGLVAGYPWYASLWCRDLAEMIPAVLWMGDFDQVRASLDTVFRFQPSRDLPMLGARTGSLPMQISTGPVLLYGTADTPLYYPGLVEQFLRHSGEPTVPDGWARALEGILGWARARQDPSNGLLTHGHEVEDLIAATSAVARVRFGIDQPDTTIWDSADRRDQAVDIQVLWHQALGALRRMAPGASPDRIPASELDRIAETIRQEYRWPEEAYLADSLRAGHPVRTLRPNALRAVSAGLLRGPAARRMVERAARPDLLTPWGVRSLASTDPTYAPAVYHQGQVWTLATAWLADAAFAAGDVDRGLQALRTIADRFAAEGGYAHECYRGDRPEPFNSCFLLGFSIAPFLTILFERLWGLRREGAGPRLTIDPSFPASWTSATLEGLRVGAGRVRIDWSPGELRVDWSGPGPLSLGAAGREHRLEPGGTGRFPLPAPPGG